MDWKETVMTKFQREVVWKEPLTDKYDSHDSHIARSQAEISFKAGIKEVVEWVEKHELDICGYTGSKGSITGSEDWQAKLKEWGVK